MQPNLTDQKQHSENSIEVRLTKLHSMGQWRATVQTITMVIPLNLGSFVCVCIFGHYVECQPPLVPILCT